MSCPRCGSAAVWYFGTHADGQEWWLCDHCDNAWDGRKSRGVPPTEEK